MRTRSFLLTAVASLLLAGTAAAADDAGPTVAAEDTRYAPVAEDDEDDALDDILNEEDSIKKEVEDVRSGDLDDTIGAAREDVLLPEEQARRRRVIKTLQRKTFLKLGRVEAGPHLAFVANDPFLNRYILGGFAGYHLTEVFEVELDGGFAPDLGETDWKPLTKQLSEGNRVLPDISKLIWYGTLTFNYSPIYGKVAVGSRTIIFDIFGLFGMGVAQTKDDLTALGSDAASDPRATSTATQIHPTTNLGGGLRIALSPNFAVRVEGRSLTYIETVQATTLEMKNNLVLQAGASFFIPRMRS